MIAIYLILDDAECPRYVGKSYRPGCRVLDHFRMFPAWAKSWRVLEWVEQGVRWQERERFWIKYYRRFCAMENVARGGGSSSPKSPKTIALHAAKIRGQKRSEETRANLRLAIARRSPERKREIAAKISAAKRGRSPRLTDAERERRRLAIAGKKLHQGHRHSAETIAILRAKNMGRAPNSGSFKKKPRATEGQLCLL